MSSPASQIAAEIAIVHLDHAGEPLVFRDGAIMGSVSFIDVSDVAQRYPYFDPTIEANVFISNAELGKLADSAPPRGGNDIADESGNHYRVVSARRVTHGWICACRVERPA